MTRRLCHCKPAGRQPSDSSLKRPDIGHPDIRHPNRPVGLAVPFGFRFLPFLFFAHAINPCTIRMIAVLSSHIRALTAAKPGSWFCRRSTSLCLNCIYASSIRSSMIPSFHPRLPMLSAPALAFERISASITHHSRIRQPHAHAGQNRIAGAWARPKHQS